MNIITPSVRIKSTNNPSLAIIQALCDFGTLEDPREPSVNEKWNAIKTVRNELLTLCDWTQAPDAALTLSEKVDWQVYRQALRDIPQTYDNPENVQFPDPPGGA